MAKAPEVVKDELTEMIMGFLHDWPSSAHQRGYFAALIEVYRVFCLDDYRKLDRLATSAMAVLKASRVSHTEGENQC